jgi:hypothetical protein
VKYASEVTLGDGTTQGCNTTVFSALAGVVGTLTCAWEHVIDNIYRRKTEIIV